MKGERSGEEKEETLVPCMHQQWDWRSAKRVILFTVKYGKIERTVYHENKRICIRGDVKTINQIATNQEIYNPVDCNECRDEIIDFLAVVLSHPNPDAVMSDICKQLNDHIIHLKTSSLEVVNTTASKNCSFMWLSMLEKLSNQACAKTQQDVNALECPTVCSVNYHLVNKIERHCYDKREWVRTWVGVSTPGAQHPRLVLDKVEQGSEEVVSFTCPICLEGQVDDTKGDKKRGRGYVRLPCKHIYHESCISLWLDDELYNNCPLCRFQLPETPFDSVWNINESSSIGFLDVMYS